MAELDFRIVGLNKKQLPANRIKYGHNDKLPNEILEAIMESGTARDCWDKIDSFTQADGFSNLDAANFQVNPKQKADEVLGLLTSDNSYIEGYCIRVKYAFNLTDKEIYHVPFHTHRLLEDGNYLVNPTLGTKRYDPTKDEILPPYNPDSRVVGEMLKTEYDRVNGVIEEMKQGGQLLVVFNKNAASPYYPIPKHWTLAGSKDIKSDTEIAVTDFDNLENNFTPPVIIFKAGQYDNKIVNPNNGLTQLEELKDDIDSLTAKENRSKAILITGKTLDEAPKLINYDNTKGILSLDAKRETIANAVCRHFGVPPILVGLYKAGALSQSKEILNAISLFQSSINRKQRMLQRTFEMLFPVEDENFWMISTLNVLNEIPPEVWAEMTPEERRAAGGLAALETPLKTETDANIES